jgi:hypothetical protein
MWTGGSGWGGGVYREFQKGPPEFIITIEEVIWNGRWEKPWLLLYTSPKPKVYWHETSRLEHMKHSTFSMSMVWNCHLTVTTQYSKSLKQVICSWCLMFQTPSLSPLSGFNVMNAVMHGNGGKRQASDALSQLWIFQFHLIVKPNARDTILFPKSEAVKFAECWKILNNWCS